MPNLGRRMRRSFVRSFVVFTAICMFAMFLYVLIDQNVSERPNLEKLRQVRANALQRRFLRETKNRVQAVARNTSHRLPSLEKKPVGPVGKVNEADLLEKNPIKYYLWKSNNLPLPNYNVHAFYYPWYGTPDVDGEYIHWNHPFLPHWNKEETAKYPSGKHQPPDDIGSNFYPEIGAYSSKNETVVHLHMYQIRLAGIGVAVVSWYPPDKKDDNGKSLDSVMPLLLQVAHEHKLKIAIHSEPYKERDATHMRNDIVYFMDKYGNHPAMYRFKKTNDVSLPMVYVYDSYLTDTQDWIDLLQPNGKSTVRGTKYDCVFISLLVTDRHKGLIERANFDGFYTYFAANGFTYGSTHRNWPQLKEIADKTGKLFIPSIGPGYVDTQVRPWNGQTTRDRQSGMYYMNSFQDALRLKPPIVSITSFNEWHEGTQIEPAVPKKTPQFTYLDYGKQGPLSYLEATRHYASLVGHQ
ncbi:glycoprotein endo-alpha-1,2-mannosidase-like [Oscarella lobularis]|uniref:glycoprotein endo-alpha-1,2-mannosidase-like n=1 Tax=Oscarella lobularis TaxID=121494 RepID=UPI003313A84C